MRNLEDEIKHIEAQLAANGTSIDVDTQNSDQLNNEEEEELEADADADNADVDDFDVDAADAVVVIEDSADARQYSDTTKDAHASVKDVDVRDEDVDVSDEDMFASSQPPMVDSNSCGIKDSDDVKPFSINSSPDEATMSMTSPEKLENDEKLVRKSSEKRPRSPSAATITCNKRRRSSVSPETASPRTGRQKVTPLQADHSSHQDGNKQQEISSSLTPRRRSTRNVSPHLPSPIKPPHSASKKVTQESNTSTVSSTVLPRRVKQQSPRATKRSLRYDSALNDSPVDKPTEAEREEISLPPSQWKFTGSGLNKIMHMVGHFFSSTSLSHKLLIIYQLMTECFTHFPLLSSSIDGVFFC